MVSHQRSAYEYTRPSPRDSQALYGGTLLSAWWRDHLEHILGEDHLLCPYLVRIARRSHIAQEQPDTILRICNDFGYGIAD